MKTNENQYLEIDKTGNVLNRFVNFDDYINYMSKKNITNHA
jgi:hypothetical protein